MAEDFENIVNQCITLFMKLDDYEHRDEVAVHIVPSFKRDDRAAGALMSVGVRTEWYEPTDGTAASLREQNSRHRSGYGETMISAALDWRARLVTVAKSRIADHDALRKLLDEHGLLG